jgi:hypothetical protein
VGKGVAAVVLGIQGLALGGVCTYYLVEIFTGHPHNLGIALFGDALGFVTAAVLAVLARPLRDGRHYPLAPVLLLEAIAVPIGIELVQAHQRVSGFAVAVPAGLVLVLLVLQQAFPQPHERAGE